MFDKKYPHLSKTLKKGKKGQRNKKRRNIAQIESFFKDLKSRFKIKTFVGTSSNAVEIQIWTALITMLVLKYLRSISKYNWSLSNLIAFLRMHLFTKMELEYWLDTPFKPPGEEIQKSQYSIFENIKND